MFGLGLFIANAIVTGHGGTLSLADRAAHGLVARLAFPLESAAAGRVAPAAAA